MKASPKSRACLVTVRLTKGGGVVLYNKISFLPKTMVDRPSPVEMMVEYANHSAIGRWNTVISARLYSDRVHPRAG